VDKRLVVELVPGVAFLAGNAMAGIFAGAGLAAVATAVAVVLRWRWDRSLPWLAVAIFVLTLILLLAGLVFDDTTFVKVGATVGSLAFAVIIGAGMILRPSLVQRTLGYRLTLTARGWRVLEMTWIGLSLLRAALNEAVWRTASDGVWAIYNGVSDVLWIGVFVLVTSAIAHMFWCDAGPGSDGLAGSRPALQETAGGTHDSRG
jgi:intracellular septation protein